METVSPVEEKSKRLGIPSFYQKQHLANQSFKSSSSDQVHMSCRIQTISRIRARKCGRNTEHRLTRSLVNPQQDRTMSTELQIFKLAEHSWNSFRPHDASQNVLIALPVLRSALPIWNWSEMSDTSRATNDQSTAIMFFKTTSTWHEASVTLGNEHRGNQHFKD